MNKDNWISVEEKLPEKRDDGFSDRVLTIDIDGRHRILCRDYMLYNWTLIKHYDNQPTHWQPLPEPPNVIISNIHDNK